LSEDKRELKWARFGELVFVQCPECGFKAALDHDIAEDGTVTPSLVCPNQNCDFHEFVKLRDWRPPT